MKIGKVTVLGELGVGAGSRVSLVRREADSLEYALKVAQLGKGRTRKYLAQCQNEFRIAAMLDHPNLIQMYAIETDAGWFSGPTTIKLLIEYAPGRTLDMLPRLPVRRLIGVFERVADAIAHMHERGVIHADLKPNNLILDSGTHIKVIDYGVAQLVGEQVDRLWATPEFVAPETLTQRLLNEKTDIYSLGVTMYWLTTLRYPPPAQQVVVTGEGGFERQYQSVTGFNPTVPDELSELIRECVSFNPNRRPASMEVVRDALAHIAEAHGAGSNAGE